ncbi:MAG: FAD-dependent oxidoreductase [Promethearchaeota archaeon]
MRNVSLSYDVVVVGGGFAGTVAAISAARNGSRVILVQDRPVLGGNGSSEVRVHVGGASEHGHRYDARESGILEEIRLETAVRDPFNTYSWIDAVLYTWCEAEPNLDVLLNTHVHDLKRDGDTIVSVVGINNGNETFYDISGKMFIDGTGHGTIGALAGAEYRKGREARGEFNESIAPVEADDHTLGASILFQAMDRGHPVDFKAPAWAKDFSKERPPRHIPGKSSNHEKYWHTDTSGWWWVEYGGALDTVHDSEVIRKELQAIVLGVWDFIKNHHYNQKTREQARNFAITWMGAVPGHRESRRLMGDYILNQNDLMAGRIFDDQIAVGGWSVDLHPPGGFWDARPSANQILMDATYTIPFRSIYSKNIPNLLFASRCISATHVAHGSTRLIATLSLIGQAAGAAAHACIQKQCNPRELLTDGIKDLQQALIKEDHWLLGIKNEDVRDLALHAHVSSNSEFPCKIEGVDRWVPLYFPVGQRFHLPPSGRGGPAVALFYMKNASGSEQVITGGLRLDGGRYAFKAREDVATFSITLPGNSEGWFEATPVEGELDFSRGGPYWIYLNGCDDDGVAWGMNAYHWPAMSTGFLHEESGEWKQHVLRTMAFYDPLMGERGAFCFEISNVPSPYPASSINNGYHRPHVGPNLWISAPFRETYKIPHLLTAIEREDRYKFDSVHDEIEVYVEFNEVTTFSEIWFTFDTDLDNPYPHQNYEGLRSKDWPIHGKAPNCIAEMDIFIEEDPGNARELVGRIKGNYQRRYKFKLERPVSTKKIILVPRKNWGFHCYGLYEVRIY